jgi:thiol-disulfide isomerase/thioredoxin
MSARRTALASPLALLLAGAIGVLAAGFGSPRPAAAQAADALLSGFAPNGDFLLVVDGKNVPQARIYDSKRAGALLIRSAAFDSPVLLDRVGGTVQTVDLMKVSERSDGSIDLLADASLAPSGTFRIEGEQTLFTVGGKQAALKRNPYLLGPKDGRDLLDHDAYYRFLAAKYQPDTSALGLLRAEKRRVRVLTFFGSWCPHCKEHVPLLLKAASLLDGAAIDFDFYGLPRSGLNSEVEAKKWGVQAVPTSIVLVDDKEVGRIPSSGWARPESAIASILSPSAASGAR